jgi:hypothetical protein
MSKSSATLTVRLSPEAKEKFQRLGGTRWLNECITQAQAAPGLPGANRPHIEAIEKGLEGLKRNLAPKRIKPDPFADDDQIAPQTRINTEL